MIFIFIIVLFFSIYAAMNYYIGLRCWQALGSQLHFLNSKVYWIIFAFVVASYILGRVGNKVLPAMMTNGLTYLGAYWMAAMVYGFLAVLLIDIARLINHWTGFLPASMTNNAFAFRLGTAVILSGLLLLVFGTWWARNIQIKQYEVSVPKQAGELKALHAVIVSDLHLGNIVDKKYLRRVVDGVNAQKPDIVLIPGDIIDDDIEPFIKQGMGEEFRRIRTKYGIYACLGNHDYYGGRAGDTLDQFEKAGITILKDTSVKVGDSFYVIGREDKTAERSGKQKRKPLKQLVAGMDPALPKILLDHEPGSLEEAKGNGIDLQISGHTHEGQIFPGNLITKMVFEVDYGYLEKGPLQVIVSSGAGTWGPPIRLGTASEIVDVKISFE